ncbi:MAG: hypothetical protein JXA71_10200, partial [Chitinispirillaceae bacterium]|nr:hypothetical protein [Chitinispirillaceae bacterium]
MIFRSNPTFVMPGKRPFRRHDAALCAILTAALFSPADAGLYHRTSFPVTGNGTVDSNMVLENGALGLAIDRYETVTLQSDSMVAFNRTIPSFYPDVIAGNDSAFTFFWADQLGINKREYRIGSDLVVTPGMVQKVGDLAAADTNLCFLHGARGTNGHLVSYVFKGTLSQSRVRLINGTAQFDLDSSTTNLLHQSLCAGVQDTYYVAYADNFQTLTLAKVYSRDADLHVVDTVTVAVQTVLVSIYTPSVAADTNGLVVVTWLEGGQTTSKDLYYRVFNRSLQPLNNKTLLAANTASRLRIHYYDHAPGVAYAPGRFAVASWDSAGV